MADKKFINNKKPKYGEVYYAELESDGSVQGGCRPVIIVQNDIGNAYSDVTNAIVLTSNVSDKKQKLPVHVLINPSKYNGLKKKSIAMLEQIRPIPNNRLREQIGKIESEYEELFAVAALNQLPFLKKLSIISV